MKKLLSLVLTLAVLISAGNLAFADTTKESIRNHITNWDTVKRENSGNIMVEMLEVLPLEKSTTIKVDRVLTKDRDFIVNDGVLREEFISLTAGSSNKIYHILLSDGSLLTTDPDYSYGKRAAFVLDSRQKNAKIVKAFLGTNDPKKGTIVVDVNIDLSRERESSKTSDWEYNMDKFKLSNWIGR